MKAMFFWFLPVQAVKMDMSIKKILTIITLSLLLISVIILFLFGENIRYILSAKAEATFFSTSEINGEYYPLCLPNECIIQEGDTCFIYIAELSGEGKNAQYTVAKKNIKIITRNESLTAIKGFSDTNAYILISYDRKFEEGTPVVITALKNIE